MTKTKILIYTDSRGQHTPRNQPVHPVFAERLASRMDVEATVVLCPMKWTTTLDFLDFLDRNGAENYDHIVIQLGIVDWSPRPQPSAWADLYDNQNPNNIGNDNLNTREYARKVVNNKKNLFDAMFGEAAIQTHLATPLGAEFEGQPTANMYSLDMAKEHLLPRLAALDKLIFVTTNRFATDWQGDYARGRPSNITISESYSEAFRDALGPDRVVDLLKWTDAEIKQYTCDNIHLTKQGSDYVYDALCELMNLPFLNEVDFAAPYGLMLPKAPAPLSMEQQNDARRKAGVPEGQPLASLIIGVRFADGDKFRVSNLETLLRQIDQTYGNLFDVLIVEQDRQSKFKAQRFALPDGVRHEFIYNPFEFNRGWAYNVAVKSYSDAKVVALLDTDVLLGDNFLDEILACHGQYKVISPYQNVYFTTEAEAEPMRGKGSDLADFSALNRDNGVSKPTTISGGIVIFQRHLYLELGGFEQYTSYGGEDRALDVALLAVCARSEIRVAPASYVHLYHPPVAAQTGALRAILAHLHQNYGCRVDRTLGATDYIHRNCTHVGKTEIARLVEQRAESFGDVDLYQFGHTTTINGTREPMGDGKLRINAIFPPEFSNLHDYEAKELYKAPDPDRDALAGLYNKFRGERCFIIGNGPSLNRHDLKLLENEYTFAVNSIFYKTEETGFRPTFFVVEDNMVMRDNLEKIKAYQAPYKFFPTNYKSMHGESENTYFFRMNRGFYEKSSPYYCVPRFSSDVSSILYCGQSVTYINLQLAYFMGFTEVHLIGMDFEYVIPPEHKQKGDLILSTGDDPNHFHKDYFGAGKTWKDPKLDRVGMNYREAKAVYDAVGRTIYNSTIGGKLEIFERADYNALFMLDGPKTRPDSATVIFPEGKLEFGESAAKTGKTVTAAATDVELLYNAFKGKRCFILDGGAALSDHDAALLADEFTFGVNLADGTGAEFVPTFLMLDYKSTVSRSLELIRSSKAPYKFLPTEAYGLADDLGNAFYFKIDRDFDVNSSLHYKLPRFSTDASKGLFSGHQPSFMAAQLAFFMGFTEVYVMGDDGGHAEAGSAMSGDYEQVCVSFEAVGRRIGDVSGVARFPALQPVNFADLFIDRAPTGARQAPIITAAGGVVNRNSVSSNPVRGEAPSLQYALPPGSGVAAAIILKPVEPAYAPFGNWLKERSPLAFNVLRSVRRLGPAARKFKGRVAISASYRSLGLFRIGQFGSWILRAAVRHPRFVAAVLTIGIGAALLPLLWQPLWDFRTWFWVLSAVMAVAGSAFALDAVLSESIRRVETRHNAALHLQQLTFEELLAAQKKYLVERDVLIHKRFGADVRELKSATQTVMAGARELQHQAQSLTAVTKELKAQALDIQTEFSALNEGVRQAANSVDMRLAGAQAAMSLELGQMQDGLDENTRQMKSRISNATQESTVEVVSALRAISKIWFNDASLPAGPETEHGHILLMKTMAAREAQSPGTLRGKTVIEVGTTREHVPSQGSTSKLAIFTGLLDMAFVTVDMDPANTKAAATFIAYLNPAAKALTAKGEDYLAVHEGTLDYVYLDAFDFYHDHHSEARQSRYQEFLGTDINDAACWEMHRLCADAIIAKMVPGGLVSLDDTWLDAAGDYAGKGKFAVPLLLQHDFDIVATSKTTVVLERRPA